MIKIEIGSPEWLEMRRKYITATDAAAIMGLSPYKTPLQLYNEKIKGTRTEINAAMQRGLDLEPLARLTFEQETGHMVSPEWRAHKSIEWMAATFDGINDDGIVLEIKCPGEKDHLIACEGKIPPHYMPQLQHQMKVAEVGQMYYFSYRPEYKIAWTTVRVSADRDFQEKMLEAEKEFYDRLQNKLPPEPIADRDIVLRENRSFLRTEEALWSIKMKRKKLDEEEAILKQCLIDQCQGQASHGYKLKIVPVEVEGRIDYDSIPQLKGLDLSQYRKPTTTQWRCYDL